MVVIRPEAFTNAFDAAFNNADSSTAVSVGELAPLSVSGRLQRLDLIVSVDLARTRRTHDLATVLSGNRPQWQLSSVATVLRHSRGPFAPLVLAVKRTMKTAVKADGCYSTGNLQRRLRRRHQRAVPDVRVVLAAVIERWDGRDDLSMRRCADLLSTDRVGASPSTGR